MSPAELRRCLKEPQQLLCARAGHAPDRTRGERGGDGCDFAGKSGDDAYPRKTDRRGEARSAVFRRADALDLPKEVFQDQSGRGIRPRGSERSQQAPEKGNRRVPQREQELREAIVACGIRLVDEGLVQGTWGNIAVRLDETHMLCTPSGLAYHFLTPDDIVKVELATLAYGDQRKPTSEKRLHRDLFAARPDAGASIHTHAKRCGVFAAARKTICCISGEMKELVGEEMRCAGHALPSTKKLSKVALGALGNRNGCLLMNHGVLCCGSDLEQAYRACKAAEQAAGEQLGLE